jgi:hypothetical protein
MVSFLYFLVSFLHRAQLWAERLGMSCNAVNVERGITVSGKWCIGTMKREDILKLCDIGKQDAWHQLSNVMHRHLNPDAQCSESEFGGTIYEQLLALRLQQVRATALWSTVTHNLISNRVMWFSCLFFFLSFYPFTEYCPCLIQFYHCDISQAHFSCLSILW